MISVLYAWCAGVLALAGPSFQLPNADRTVPAAEIDKAMLRKTVKALYSDLNVERVGDRSEPAVMVILLFDRDENVIRHALRTRTTDRMFAFDVVNDAFGPLSWSRFDHTGILALTGSKSGVEAGTVWVIWGQLKG